MIIAGCGIFLIFSADQGEAKITGPYPPFGVATMTVLNTTVSLTVEGIVESGSKFLLSISAAFRESQYYRLFPLVQQPVSSQEALLFQSIPERN